VTIGTNKYNHKKVVCFHAKPLSRWENILHIKEYFATSQKLNPCGMKIFNGVAWILGCSRELAHVIIVHCSLLTC
jgi:hypothetical protein